VAEIEVSELALGAQIMMRLLESTLSSYPVLGETTVASGSTGSVGIYVGVRQFVPRSTDPPPAAGTVAPPVKSIVVEAVRVAFVIEGHPPADSNTPLLSAMR
jgi:hypothetical protein